MLRKHMIGEYDLLRWVLLSMKHIIEHTFVRNRLNAVKRDINSILITKQLLHNTNAQNTGLLFSSNW